MAFPLSRIHHHYPEEITTNSSLVWSEQRAGEWTANITAKSTPHTRTPGKKAVKVMWTLRAVKQQTQTTEAAAAWAMILESREDVVTTMLQLRFFLEVNHDTIDQKLPETMSQMLRLAVNWQKKCNETIYAGTLRDQNDDEVCSFHDGTVLAQRQKMSAWSWMARE